MIAINNQQFCYWLQGYFEIANGPVTIKKPQVELIAKTLQTVSEPLWPLLEWLVKVCEYCKIQEYHADTLAYFQPLIQNTLAQLFHHVIDESYDTETSSEIRQMIHDGKIDYDKR